MNRAKNCLNVAARGKDVFVMMETEIAMNEIWKSLIGYEGWYSASNDGKIRRDKGGGNSHIGKILKQTVSQDGYYLVGLSKNKIKKTYKVHRLVARAFAGETPNGKQINHKDGNKLNNNINNFEYCTPSENSQHAYRTGLSDPFEKNKMIALRKTNSKRRKLNDEQVKKIKYLRLFTGWGRVKIADLMGVDKGAVQTVIMNSGYSEILGETIYEREIS